MSTRGLTATVAAAAIAGLVSCGTRTARTPGTGRPPFEISALELVGSYSLPPSAQSDPLSAARTGGVSGLAVDPRTGEIVGISDDHPINRVFIFEPGKPALPFRIDLRAYFPLPIGRDGPREMDSEGIAITRSGHMFVSSEGLPELTPPVQPAIVEYTRRMDYVRTLAIPVKFLQPAGAPPTHGIRRNEGFESLTLAPDEQHLYTAAESSLAQDGERATFELGTTARFLEFTLKGATFVAGRELPYPLEPVPHAGFTPRFMLNGLVELMSLGGAEFLSMDRAYAEDAANRATVIRIYRTSIDGATDISAMDSIRGRAGLVPARKRLLLEVNKAKGLPAELDVPAFDNFEGMCFGPMLADGSRTLLLVSDDNFSTRQRTWFLLFRIVN